MLPPAKPRSRRPTSRTTRRLFAKRRLRAEDARQRQVEAGLAFHWACGPPKATREAARGWPRPSFPSSGTSTRISPLPAHSALSPSLVSGDWGRVYSAPLWMGRCRRSVIGDPNSSDPGGTRDQTCRDFNRERRGSRTGTCGRFRGRFRTLSLFLSSDVIMKWSCFASLHVARVSLSDVRVL